MKTRIFVLLHLSCFLLASPAWSRVYVRWRETVVPPPEVLGLQHLVVSVDQARHGLAKTAASLGYRVYAEVGIEEASAAADTSASMGLSGLIVHPGAGESSQAGFKRQVQRVRSAHPEAEILLLGEGGQQPQLRGNVVSKRDGILEVSSPTIQPWIDSNLALIRYMRSENRSQTPLIDFQWDRAGPLEKDPGPGVLDYALAVAEAGAFHFDLILDIHDDLARALLRRQPASLKAWSEVRRYIEFYARREHEFLVPVVNIAVVTENLEESYEACNLMARRNLPFDVLRPGDIKASIPPEYDVMVVFSNLGAQAVHAVEEFAARGGVAILCGLTGSFPWHLSQYKESAEHAKTYFVGAGKVIELSNPPADPEAFAQDVHRLLGKEKALMTVWNALTTLVVMYHQTERPGIELRLVNYAQEPIQVQVRVRGTFSSIRFASPEGGCCDSLTPFHRNGSTEFLVPNVRIGATVQLEPSARTSHLTNQPARNRPSSTRRNVTSPGHTR